MDTLVDMSSKVRLEMNASKMKLMINSIEYKLYWIHNSLASGSNIVERDSTYGKRERTLVTSSDVTSSKVEVIRRHRYTGKEEWPKTWRDTPRQVPKYRLQT
ncbi:hypothetical protein EVAR_36844_1 [Eumeta japonica]|uniref:Uncharacterized protein n=1 Tax=Eumeta variegata TaxID=151549 RepID=A0A4C1WBY9_EUMVA|nr:hypothetical protein EVAR_36844_1 [Eumeta japonica]